jgi:hypothetical protein
MELALDIHSAILADATCSSHGDHVLMAFLTEFETWATNHFSLRSTSGAELRGLDATAITNFESRLNRTTKDPNAQIRRNQCV